MEQEPQTRVLNRDPTAPHTKLKERVATGPRALVPPGAGAGVAGLPPRVGRYELVRRLAHGGMATVYLGRASGAAGFEKVVAIKIIHAHLADEEDFLEMFFDEARIAAQIRHPHVVEILDLGSEAERHYMVMEWVEGETLSALVRAMRPGTLPVSVVLRILVDTLEGLGAAHAAIDGDGHELSLVHRDVSPQNLLISMGGWLKVTDFGIVKAAGQHGRTRTGELRGKVAYMSPEQARGLAVDARSDIFAVGIIAWELLHAQRLFARATDAATLERVITCEVPPLEDEALESCGDELAQGIRDWVAKALRRDVAERFTDAREALAGLKSLLRRTGDADPRTTLSSIMKSEFGERLAYVRAALRESTTSNVALGPDLSLPNPGASTGTGSLGVGIQEATGLASPRRAWAAVLLLPLLGAGAVVALAMATGLTGGAEAEANQASSGIAVPVQEPSETTQMVHWYIETEPEGASVIIDGRVHSEPTPTEVELPKSKTARSLVFTKEGMKRREVSLRPLTDKELFYKLEPEVMRPPVPSTGPIVATGASAASTASTTSTGVIKKKKKTRSGPENLTASPSTSGASTDAGASTGFAPMPNFGDEGDND